MYDIDEELAFSYYIIQIFSLMYIQLKIELYYTL